MPKMKYLTLAALFALCVGLTGAAFAADSWSADGADFPASLVWDAGYAGSVDTTNTGDTTWDASYALKSVEGATAAATAVDRWVTTSVPVVGVTVAPLAAYTFDVPITAPPISTLAYAVAATPTTPPTVSALDCNWILDKGGFVNTDTSENAISVLRFSDSAWAAPWVEECAGRLPVIVGGYGAGEYRPNVRVTRDQMAVFVARAFVLPPAAYTGGFTDVPVGYWAGSWIQQCVDAGIVGGYGDNTYRPTLVVNRDAMAVFVARGMAGGDAGVPSGPATATFTDVPTGYWAYKWVEYTVAAGVVGGYGDGTYRPGTAVDRGQMSVFVYRAAIQPTGAMVVLAGPAVTGVSTAALYDGWSSVAAGVAANPGNAYVAVDAARCAVADINVTFELRDAATPTAPAVGSYTASVTITAAQVTGAKAATAATGNPYLYAFWDIPAGLAADEYILVVTIDGNEVARKPAFTITP